MWGGLEDRVRATRTYREGNTKVEHGRRGAAFICTLRANNASVIAHGASSENNLKIHLGPD